MNIVMLGLEIFGIGVIVTALYLLMRGDGSRQQKLMQYFLMGALIQNAGYLLEFTSPTVEAAMVAVKIQYIGSLTIPISYCYFMFSYCFEKAPIKILRLLKIMDIFILGLVFTCEKHTFYYSRTEWKQTVQGHGYLSLEYGPGYWLFMVCGLIVPYAFTLYALIRVCIKKPDYAADRKYRLILILSFLPVIVLCSYVLKLTYVYDFTPLALGLTLSSVVILIWSRKVYDFSSLASGILLESMSDGVIAIDKHERIVSFNPAAAGIFKELNIRAIGKHIEELNGFPHGMLEEDTREEFCLNDRFYQGHVKMISDKYEEKKGYVLLILDVTETRNYIEEIKQVREQAEQANIAKSAFLANMSHEIRTPMNAIVGLSDIIMEESRGRKVYEYACDIKSSSRNLLALINDILDLSKVEAGKMKLVLTEYHIKTLVNEVLNMMDIVASKKGLMLESEYDMSIPCRYMGDEIRIKQILINLLNNALKFTRQGRVKISIAGMQGEEADSEWIVFRIEDTGCGIREEDLEKIFDNFRQLDSKRSRSVEGTGLGLSITKHLVELMQGTIKVESIYGEGTVFTVKILQKIADYRPLAEIPEGEVQEEETLEPFTAKECKVLVVDDNLINRKVARSFLQSYRLEITEAESGMEAIKHVGEKRFDIIFMDHMMPEMDGIEAVEKIRNECGENGRSPIIIALTANAMEGVRETFLSSGFQDFITKPVDRRALHMVLLKWIPKEMRTEGGTWMNALEANDDKYMRFRNILIEGIDTDKVSENYSGSVEEYNELLSLYCLDGKRKLKVLRELWENQDYTGYGIEVHALKSASANVGAVQVSNRAREQERAVNRKDITFVDSHAHRLLEEYEEQLAHIQNYLEKIQKADEDKVKEKEIEKTDLLQAVKMSLDSLENFQAKECSRKIEEILEYRLDESIEKELEKIREQLKLYEDDEAEQMLRELIEQIEKGDERQWKKN
ncbi:hypothetical protein C819_01180 [Lachnospiraceae bacterium 10-1]|nr:hypothetical protein C819_01180 [Lachnospiraceae bacterium 10-1]